MYRLGDNAQKSYVVHRRLTLKQTESFQTDDAKFISFAQMSKGCFYGFSDDFSFSLSI